MSSGPHHYTEAERLIKIAEREYGDSQAGDPYPACAATLAAAQVHATLALAAATVVDLDEGDSAWMDVLK